MSSDMSVALVGVSSALIGTILGGLLTYFTNRNLKIKEWQLSVIKEEINDKKKLYGDFLAEATGLSIISIQTKLGDLKEFEHLHDLLAIIELVASSEVVEAAKELSLFIVDAHVNSKTKNSDEDFYKLKTVFIESVKKEMNELQKK